MYTFDGARLTKTIYFCNKNKLGYVLMQIMAADKGQDFENETATFPLLI